MDINQQLQPIVAGLITDLKGSIEKELRQQVSGEVVKTLASTELNGIVTTLIQQNLQKRIDAVDITGLSEVELQKIVRQITDQVTRNLATTANTQISTFVKEKLTHLDINSIVNSIVKSSLGDTLTAGSFPDGSIPHSSVNFKGFSITGDAINGGIISNFGSTGIEDRATHVQMTLMDHATAFEGPVWAPELYIKGDTKLDGKLVLNGDFATDTAGFKNLIGHTSHAVREVLNAELFASFSDIIFNKIQTDGIDLDKVTQAGKEVVSGNRLGYHIIDTNIQRVGVLNDLQTSGENLLCDTLYVSSRRVGINTMDPSTALAVWDEEVEIAAGKQSQDIGYIGTPRHQQLVLGANGKQNLTLDVDGTVKVAALSIGDVLMTSDTRVPNYEGRTGQLVWNSSPSHGGAIGWVCLGGTRWAKFGTIE